MSFQPRRATRADLAAVRAVVRAAFSPYIVRIGREPAPMGEDYGALIDEGRVHVTEQDGHVAAVIVLVPQEDAMLLDTVAVAPEMQGRGLGRALLAFAEREARAAGHGEIRLYTNEAMTENIALYSRLGYRETRRAQENGFRRVHMGKPLA